jgi:hypothetical protein
MSINNDSVMRSVYYKYMHPKEVFIAEGTLIPDLIRKKVSRIDFKDRSRAASKRSIRTFPL